MSLLVKLQWVGAPHHGLREGLAIVSVDTNKLSVSLVLLGGEALPS